MRIILIQIFILLLHSIPASGQAPGWIGAFSDQVGINFNFIDYPGLMNVYVFHHNTNGATGCRFRAPQPSCMDAMYLSEVVTPPFTGTGDSQTGIFISYGACMQSPIHILTISYFAQGNTPNCCCYFILPDSASEPYGIQVTDCSDPPQLMLGHTYIGIINPAMNQCSEHSVPETCINYTVPVENSTWGAIKSLYK
jgi:hypothetical protein